MDYRSRILPVSDSSSEFNTLGSRYQPMEMRYLEVKPAETILEELALRVPTPTQDELR